MHVYLLGLPWWLSKKESTFNAGAAGDMGLIPGSGKIPPEEDMTIHSSILAWRNPRAKETGGLQSIGSQRVGHDWGDLAPTHPHKKHGFNLWVGKFPWSRKWQATPVFLPGKFHKQSPWDCKESDMTEHAHIQIYNATLPSIIFRCFPIHIYSLNNFIQTFHGHTHHQYFCYQESHILNHHNILAHHLHFHLSCLRLSNYWICMWAVTGNFILSHKDLFKED